MVLVRVVIRLSIIDGDNGSPIRPSHQVKSHKNMSEKIVRNSDFWRCFFYSTPFFSMVDFILHKVCLEISMLTGSLNCFINTQVQTQNFWGQISKDTWSIFFLKLINIPLDLSMPPIHKENRIMQHFNIKILNNFLTFIRIDYYLPIFF